MAILGQILGTSFGRQPTEFGTVRMPGINIPQMAPDPGADMYHAPAQGQQGQGQGQQGQSVDDIINGFKARLQAMRGGSGGAQGIGPEPAPVPVTAAPGVGDPMAMPSMAGGVSGGAPGGVMNSIMGAFNAGAGGGMDMGQLMAMLPMLGI